MRIISLCSFWAVNQIAGFCHVVAQMIMMNEMILSRGFPKDDLLLAQRAS